MNFTAKVHVLGTIFLIAFVVIFIRLAYWQIIENGRLSSEADQEHYSALEIPARRGEIKASDGSVLVADKNTHLLYAQLPKLPTDHQYVADKLAPILAVGVPLVATPGAQISPDDQAKFLKDTQDNLNQALLTRLNTSGAVWLNLAHFLSDDQQKQITGLNIPGLGFEDETARDYPEASAAAHLLGFVGSDANGNPAGYFGLEGYYQRELAGQSGEIRLEKDAFGRPIAIGEETRIAKQDGSDLQTTIDRAVQRFVEAELVKGISDWQASGGTAIVADPNTGAIIALASFPAFDPANFAYYSTSSYKDPAISDLYEPGSIMKPMVMAAAINEGKVTPETQCTLCTGPAEVSGILIHTFDNQYHPNTTMTNILVNSDNTGMVFVGKQLGFPLLYSYLTKFGFSQPTGVDLEGEVSGQLRNFNNYRLIDQATMTFGQGIVATSLQMVRAISTIANGGRLVTPFVVDSVVRDGKTIKIPHPLGPRIISTTTAQTVAEMMVHVADESPEHFPKDRIPELASFRIAAKSGTAQIAVGGKYAATGTVGSLEGFFPAEKPRYVIFVKLDSPEVRPWGSDTAGPIFFAIIKDLINYYGIAPQ